MKFLHTVHVLGILVVLSYLTALPLLIPCPVNNGGLVSAILLLHPSLDPLNNSCDRTGIGRYRYGHRPHQPQYLYQYQFQYNSDDVGGDNTAGENCNNDDNRQNKNSIAINSSSDTNNSTNNNKNKMTTEEDVDCVLSLQDQAMQLRREAEQLQRTLEQTKQQKIQRERDKVDQWIEALLIQTRIDDNSELLKNTDQVSQYMMEERYSAEQVLKIFTRLNEVRIESGRRAECRSDCSPLMSLLVEATNKLDCTERDQNPNKRWKYKVERILQKKLFASDWNIDYVDEDEQWVHVWHSRVGGWNEGRNFFNEEQIDTKTHNVD